MSKKNKITENNNKNNENYQLSYIIDTEKNTYTELHISCIMGNTNMIKLLLDSNLFNINEQSGKYKLTPLMLLIIKEENAKFLLRYKPDVNISDIYNNTPFIYMLKYSKLNEDIYQLLIDNNAYIDYKLFINDTSFSKCVYNNSLFVKFFINKKIKIKLLNINQFVTIKNPLSFIKRTNPKYINILYKYPEYNEMVLNNNGTLNEKDKMKKEIINSNMNNTNTNKNINEN
eukprot:jgi/Orpsp1_1/1176244/evm.model.c7180000056932.1